MDYSLSFILSSSRQNYQKITSNEIKDKNSNNYNTLNNNNKLLYSKLNNLELLKHMKNNINKNILCDNNLDEYSDLIYKSKRISQNNILESKNKDREDTTLLKHISNKLNYNNNTNNNNKNFYNVSYKKINNVKFKKNTFKHTKDFRSLNDICKMIERDNTKYIDKVKYINKKQNINNNSKESKFLMSSIEIINNSNKYNIINKKMLNKLIDNNFSINNMNNTDIYKLKTNYKTLNRISKIDVNYNLDYKIKDLPVIKKNNILDMSVNKLNKVKFNLKKEYFCYKNINNKDNPEKNITNKEQQNLLMFKEFKDVKIIDLKKSNRSKFSHNNFYKKSIFLKFKNIVINSLKYLYFNNVTIKIFHIENPFTNIPFRREKSFLFFKCIKLNDIKNALFLLNQDKMLLFDIDYFGQTCFHWTAKRNYITLLKELIYIGKHINQYDNQKRTPLYLACINNHYDIINLLLTNGANPFMEDINRKKPIDVVSDEDCKLLVSNYHNKLSLYNNKGFFKNFIVNYFNNIKKDNII